MYELNRIAVFCGSSFGTQPAYRRAAAAFGELLAARGIGLVYGGGNVGLMGALADAAMAGGTEVIGVIPRALHEREVAHLGITELEVVGTMHERKRRMYELSDAVVALPGGVGTLDELFEAFTWSQLGYHRLPCGLLNVDGYWDPLVAMLDRSTERGFVRSEHRRLLYVENDSGALLERLAAGPEPFHSKWIPA